jgi:hypothetical protein
VPYVAAADLAAAAKAPEASTGKGKGFAAKMGDRATVKSAFTLEQRQARVGKGVVEAEADEYGAEILLGGGGLVRRLCLLGARTPLLRGSVRMAAMCTAAAGPAAVHLWQRMQLPLCSESLAISRLVALRMRTAQAASQRGRTAELGCAERAASNALRERASPAQ